MYLQLIFLFFRMDHWLKNRDWKTLLFNPQLHRLHLKKLKKMKLLEFSDSWKRGIYSKETR